MYGSYYYRSVKKLSENASSKGQNKKFPTRGKGTPLLLDHFPRSLGPCHIPSKLLLLLILTEKQLKRFKKQKSPTQGKGMPLPSDHNPLQPWPFGSLHMPSTLLMFLILTFYTEHCMVSITTKALKCKIYKSKIFLSRERGYFFLWIPITCNHSPLQLGMYQENY